MQIKPLILIVVGIIVAFAAGFFIWNWYLEQTRENRPIEEMTKNVTEKSNVDIIQVVTPRVSQLIQSPVRVTGEARGTWYFEASFPVKLYDSNGNLLVAVPAQAQGEWMTEDFVPFDVQLTFATPATDTGTLVLEKDNPSGLPENADELRVPIRFR